MCIRDSSNIAPRQTHEIVQTFFDGDIAGAISGQLKAKPMIDALFAEVNPIPVKAALDIMGRSKMNFRLPLCDPEESTMVLLERELKAYGIL